MAQNGLGGFVDDRELLHRVDEALAGLDFTEVQCLRECIADMDDCIIEAAYKLIADDMYDVTAWYVGMSKFVFELGSVPNRVFKIPFDGEIMGFDWNEDMPGGLLDYVSSLGTSQYENANNGGDYSTVWRNDYCSAEEYVYLKAQDRHLEDMFARTRFLGHSRGLRIYVSDKAESLYDSFDDGDKASDNSKEIAKRYGKYDGLGEEANAIIVENYGEGSLANLIEFLDDYQVYDLHDGNLGYKNGKLVLIDYSSFRE